MTTRGNHLVLEFWGCNPATLRDREALVALCRTAAEATGAHVVGSADHAFPGEGGVTVAILLAESHLTLHGYPEVGFAACDVFTCGLTCNPSRAVPVLLEGLKALDTFRLELERGLGGSPRLKVS